MSVVRRAGSRYTRTHTHTHLLSTSMSLYLCGFSAYRNLATAVSCVFGNWQGCQLYLRPIKPRGHSHLYFLSGLVLGCDSNTTSGCSELLIRAKAANSMPSPILQTGPKSERPESSSTDDLIISSVSLLSCPMSVGQRQRRRGKFPQTNTSNLKDATVVKHRPSATFYPSFS